METRTRRGPGRAPGVEIATDRAQRGEKEEKMGGAISPLARDTVQYSTNRNFLFFCSPQKTIDSRFFVFWKREPICKYPRNTHPSGGSFFSGPDTIPRHVLRRLATFSGCCAYYCVSQVAKGAAVPLLDWSCLFGKFFFLFSSLFCYTLHLPSSRDEAKREKRGSREKEKWRNRRRRRRKRDHPLAGNVSNCLETNIRQGNKRRRRKWVGGGQRCWPRRKEKKKTRKSGGCLNKAKEPADARRYTSGQSERGKPNMASRPLRRWMREIDLCASVWTTSCSP